MIITVHSQSGHSERYPFLEKQICIGRGSSDDHYLQVDSDTVSRKHLMVRSIKKSIQVKDLNSSNGTFVGDQKVQPGTWLEVQADDRIRLAQFDGFLMIEIREESIKGSKRETKMVKKGRKQEQSSSESQSRSRSRQKEQKRELPFKISESTLKMFKDMTINKKSRQERAKFLKLMGIGQVEEYWDEIQALAKGRKGLRDGKKTSDDLERLFVQGRSSFEKRGLGK